jgi:hypothetical protein
VQADTNGNLWIAGLTFVTSSTPAGALRPGYPFTTNIVSNNGVLFQDYANNMWFVDKGADALNALALSGSPTETFASGSDFVSGPSIPGYAALGNIAQSEVGAGNDTFVMWLNTSGNNDFQVPELAAPGSQGTVPSLPSGGPLVPAAPGAVAASATVEGVANDGNQIVNFALGSAIQTSNLVEVYDNGYNEVSPGANGSTNTGYLGGYTGGTQTSFLFQSRDLAIDESGNVWVVNQYNYNAQQKSGPYGASYVNNGSSESNLTQFIGLANPVNPVAVQNAKNGTYGTKP